MAWYVFSSLYIVLESVSFSSLTCFEVISAKKCLRNWGPPCKFLQKKNLANFCNFCKKMFAKMRGILNFTPGPQGWNLSPWGNLHPFVHSQGWTLSTV
jgi:hypothetical protein